MRWLAKGLQNIAYKLASLKIAYNRANRAVKCARNQPLVANYLVGVPTGIRTPVSPEPYW